MVDRLIDRSIVPPPYSIGGGSCLLKGHNGMLSDLNVNRHCMIKTVATGRVNENSEVPELSGKIISSLPELCSGSSLPLNDTRPKLTRRAQFKPK